MGMGFRYNGLGGRDLLGGQRHGYHDADAWMADPAGPLFSAILLTLLVYFRSGLCPVSSVVSVALWPRFIQIADLGGETLVFFCLILVNFLLAEALAWLIRGKAWQALVRVAWGAVLLAGILGYGTFCLSLYWETGPLQGQKSLAVATVQPAAPAPTLWGKKGFPLEDFATPEALCVRLLTNHTVRGADLLILPELPRFDCQDAEFRLSGLGKALQHLGIPVLVPSDEFIYGPASPPVEKGGITAISREILSRYSTVFFLPPGADHPLPAYRKLKRVPFSEISPFAFFRRPWGKAAPQKKGGGDRGGGHPPDPGQ